MKLQNLLMDASIAKENFEYIASTEGFHTKQATEAYHEWQSKEQAYFNTLNEIQESTNNQIINNVENNK